jgi:flagellar FliL protein
MAEEETEVETPAPAPAPSPMKWALSGGLAIFVAVLGAQLAAPLLGTLIYGDPNAPVEEAVEGDEDLDAAPIAPPPVDFASLKPAIYVPLEPPLLASFEDASGGTRYLQMSIQAMGRDQKAMDAVRQHAPAIRNAYLFLMSNMRYEDIATLAGKEQLRAEMREEAQAILIRNTGEPGVEEIYFTSFVVQ